MKCSTNTTSRFCIKIQEYPGTPPGLPNTHAPKPVLYKKNKYDDSDKYNNCVLENIGERSNGDAGENESLRGSARVHESLGPMSTRIKDQLVPAGSPPLNKNPHLAVFLKFATIHFSKNICYKSKIKKNIMIK